jgi:hypothetical protein
MEVFYYFGALLLRVADYWVWGLAGLLILVAGGWLVSRFRRRPLLGTAGKVAGRTLAVFGALLLALSAYQVWYTHRPLPNNTQQILFDGVTYSRDVRREPHPLVIHVVTIALDTPGLSFLVTPGIPGQEYGLSSSMGISYGKNRPATSTLFLSEDNIVSVNQPVGEVYNVISGNIVFVENGRVVEGFTEDYHLTPHPRTATALSEDARTLILLVVDGRQPGYSEGVSVVELATIAIEYGAYTAINLDGGGSSTLVVEGIDGQPVVLNSPIDQRIPGRERAVANHLGVYVANSRAAGL